MFKKLLIYGMICVVLSGGDYIATKMGKPKDKVVEPTPTAIVKVADVTPTPAPTETPKQEEVKQEQKAETKQETAISKTSKQNTNSASKQAEPAKQEQRSAPKEQAPKATEKPKTSCCTNNHNHGMDCGNSNKWYSSKASAVADYTAKVKYWSDKWENYEIDTATYNKNCPSGYEVYSCPFCNKWTINYYWK